jgi:hypothetical protein
VYDKAAESGDDVGTTVWGRVSENVRKLALLYAISENHRAPQITEQAVRWAGQFVEHQTRRMLFMAGLHVADNDFEHLCLKVIQRLREAPGGELSHSVLLKRLKIKHREFEDLMATLTTRGDVESPDGSTAGPGRPGTRYRLRMARKDKG